IWRQGIDFDHIVRDLTQWYRDLVTYHRDQYLEFFEALLDANGPVLFHCSTGKDRTGVAAALLLMALGVSDVDIVANYILSKDLVYEKLFPVVPFVRGEMVRDMQERRSDALILVNTPDQDGPILERLQSAARRDVLRRWMQGEFSRIIDGLSPEDAIREAKEAMDEIVAGLDDEDPALQDIRDDIELTFEGYRDWMMELGQIPDDDFDDWMENFAWNAGNNIKPTLSVFRQWIEVALAEVRAGGGIEEFLDDYERFGMSGEAVVARLRELYLEPGQGSVQ
ncbi:MAG: tyrosine-protein phosphatase, partial [Treponema sp.]|nr:tyrosine-protein phosphatase [Treponema sp.]